MLGYYMLTGVRELTETLRKLKKSAGSQFGPTVAEIIIISDDRELRKKRTDLQSTHGVRT